MELNLLLQGHNLQRKLRNLIAQPGVLSFENVQHVYWIIARGVVPKLIDWADLSRP
jgi:hypothetical protein